MSVQGSVQREHQPSVTSDTPHVAKCQRVGRWGSTGESRYLGGNKGTVNVIFDGL